MITIFSNIFDKTPHYVSVDVAIDRIRKGKSAERIAEIRTQIDKDRANNLKKNLPSVCFSGKFNERVDSGLIEHSGFIVLDFDDVEDVDDFKRNLFTTEYIYACWVSPGGNGVKALVRIADGSRHREHFDALRELFPTVDRSGVNVSRVCYESYDPDILVRKNATVFTKLLSQTKVKSVEVVTDYTAIYQTIIKWLANRNDAFRTGERNSYIYKLASACCRYGIPEGNAVYLIVGSYAINNSSFSEQECVSAIKSAYKSPQNIFGSATMTNGVLVDSKSRDEVVISRSDDFYDPSVKAKDVLYGEDVKESAMQIYDSGREAVKPWGIPMLDKHFKRRKKEITLLSGIGNYGKGLWSKYLMLLRSIMFKEKWAIFAPEDNPAEEFYIDLVEMLLGASTDVANPSRPSRARYEWAYDWVSKHFFFLDPVSITPTPDYIKEKFLELIIKESVDGCVIDPFNQMANDYSKSGGRDDKYLETFLSDVQRFAQINNVYMDIVAHPKAMRKEGSQNYPMPGVFDLAGGAMWNNKVDNIMMYHRPNHQEDPTDPTAEVAFLKIKKQKITGIKGTITIEYDFRQRRFLFGGVDEMGKAVDKYLTPSQSSIPIPKPESQKVELDVEKYSMRPNNQFLKTETIYKEDYEQDETPTSDKAPF
jgi:hypothetical protein